MPNPAPHAPEPNTAQWLDGEQVPPVDMTPEAAAAIARHAKAALFHVHHVFDALEDLGVDLFATGSPLADLYRAAEHLAQDVDSWAIHNAYRNGADRTTWAGTERWCHTPGGVLPT